jgi:ankyrin repeat protein
MLMMLVKQGALIDAKDSNGMTPLHHAAMKKDPQTLQQNAKIIERLVTFGANIDSQMKDGSTPLHLACQSDSFANAKVLVSVPLTHHPHVVHARGATRHIQLREADPRTGH